MKAKGSVTKKGRYMGTPTLVVEIPSYSTRKRDMLEKANTYMLSGVKEYWIVDPKLECIMVYDFIDHKLDIMEPYRPGQTAKSLVFKGLAVDTGELFGDLIKKSLTDEP